MTKKFSHLSCIRFLGCVSEEARRTLQESVAREEALAHRDWNPRILTDILKLNFSTQLIDGLTELYAGCDKHSYPLENELDSMHMRILWELQVFLQRRLPPTGLSIEDALKDTSSKDASSEDIRLSNVESSLELIMLFITGFPSIKISKVNTHLPADLSRTKVRARRARNAEDIESQMADEES
eukprot:IDg17947t1